MSWRKESNLAWLRELPGVRLGEPLASRTSFGIGGPAEYFAEMANPQSIEVAIEGCRLRGIPHLLLGAGTNLLIADAGVEGLVIRVVNRDYEVEGTRIRAGAGLKMMRLARIAADAGLRGFEFAIGVPGTVGGAVYQNAGCWGHELREVLVDVRGFQPGADRRAQRDPTDQDQELWQRVHESARRLGRAVDPGGRPQGRTRRECSHFAAAWQLHRQRGRRHRTRRRGPHRTRARDGDASVWHRARA